MHDITAMKKMLLLVLLCCWCALLPAQTASPQGMWKGYLHLGTDSLALVLVVDSQDDSLTAVLDSPDQYVTDIPTTAFSLRGDTLSFAVASLGASFRGVWRGDSIAGKFRQGGRKFPLVLRPTDHRQLFPRPQEPQEPFPYQQRELSFPYHPDHHNINGTLTLPETGRPKAAIVLISGSGWQDRDESIMGHKPFKLLADYLTRQGYAVFRYDDAPPAAFQHMSTLDFAQQVHVIVDTLLQRADLQGCPVGLLGHSEGGMVAWIVASQRHDLAFVISMAGMGTPLRDVLLYQAAEGAVQQHLNVAMLQASLQLSEEVYTLVEKSSNAATAAQKVRERMHVHAEGLSNEQRAQLNLTDEAIEIAVSTLTSHWFFTLMHLKPTQYLKKVTCPVLALNGDRDRQVDAVQNVYAIRDGLKHCPDFTPCILPGLNHLFQECETGYVDEYGAIEQTLSPALLERITQWLDERMR